MLRYNIVRNRFYAKARELRATFDERFADPRSTRADRFVWDYWHVPDQYTALRTPAWEYFPEALYRDFPWLEEGERNASLQYLRPFFEAVETAERAERRFLRDCKPLP